VNVYVFNRQRDLPLKKFTANIQLITQHVVKLEKRGSFDEVSLHFISTDEMKKLHETYFKSSETTDCISFPLDSQDEVGYKILGEVFICPRTAIKYAALHGEDPYEEVQLYVIHGLLHLLGYDDLNPRDRATMRRKEKRALESLQNHRLYLDS
jgi:probable rRNA maturation factor